MDVFSAATQLYNAIPPELRAVISQKLIEWGARALEEAQRAAQEINDQEVLYKWYLNEFVKHFSDIETPDRLVPFTGSLGVDRFLLWPELSEEARRGADKPSGAEQYRGPPLPRKLKATELLTHPLNERLFAVEGAAGVGKSTMARALAYFAAKRALELMESEAGNGPQVQYLPLYFDAGDLIKLANRAQDGPITPDGEAALKEMLGAALQKAKNTPDRALLVIVDGLDEVEGPIRTKALKALSGLWLPEGNHRHLLLGRPGSISNVPWVREEKEVLKLTLKPWGEEEVREYLGRWTGAGGRPYLEADELDRLVEYMRSHLGLPSPALLVQMVVASYVDSKHYDPENPLERMPATRTELYRNYLRLLLERSEGDKKALQGEGSTARPADPELRRWLGCLELVLKQSPEQRERVRTRRCSADFLPNVTVAHARGRPCSELLDEKEESNFIKWWEDRKLCRLGHESLHEFLAAEALARLYRGDPKGFWKDWLHPSIFDPYWQQTLIFTMALMDEEDQSALMRGLLWLDSCDPISEITSRHLEVMAKAWGAGVRYNQAIWEKWLDSDPRLELLVTAASNAAMQASVQRALERFSIEDIEYILTFAGLDIDQRFTDVVSATLISTPFLGRVLQHLESEVLVDLFSALLRLKPELAIPSLERLAQEGNSEYARWKAAVALVELRPEVAIPALEWLALKGESERVRLEAAEALEKPSPKLAVSALERLARGVKDEGVRLRAIDRLGALGTAATLSLEKLAQESENDLGRQEIFKALGQVGPESIPALTRLAREAKDEDLRVLASVKLGEIGPEAAPAFEQLARSAQNKQDRLGYAEALVKLKPNAALPFLEQLLRESNAQWLWFRTANALRKVGSAAVSILEWMIENAVDGHGQFWASRVLVELKPDVAISTLERLVHEEEDEGVQVNAAEALVNLRPELAIPTLERLAQEGNSEYARCKAAVALVELRPEVAIPALEWLALKGEDEWVRLEAAEALEKPSPKLAVSALERLAQEGEGGFRRIGAVQVLEGLGPVAVPALERLALKGKDGWVRLEAARALGQLGPEAIPALERLAREGESERVRLEAARALGQLGPEAIPALERLAREGESERVRLKATGALGQVGPEAIPALERLAREGKDEDVRFEAVEALGRIGPEAIPVLERLAREGESEWVRLRAAESLVELSPEAAIPALELLAREGKDAGVRLKAAEELGRLGSPPLGCAELKSTD